MLALSARSASQNGRLSPYGQSVRGSSMGGGGVQSGGGSSLPAAILEQKIQSQHMEIQNLLTENQRLGATQVALRQELAAAQQEMQRMTSMVAGTRIFHHLNAHTLAPEIEQSLHPITQSIYTGPLAA